MNRYYLSIFDKLGYRILNPNQRELYLLDKETNEGLEKGGIDLEYRDPKNKKTIIFEERFNRYKFYLDKKEYIDFGQENYYFNEYGIWCTTLYPDNDTFVIINVGEYPTCFGLYPPIHGLAGRVQVDIIHRHSGKPTKILLVEQYYNKAKAEYSSQKGFKTTVDNERIVKPIDCTINNYMDTIIGFIIENCCNSDNNLIDKRLNEQLYLIRDSLQESLTDVLSYWKEEVIPYGLNRDKERLSLLEKDDSNNQEIDTIRQEISELEEFIGNKKRSL